jgi:membrane-bound lytic murein transglycosylase F
MKGLILHVTLAFLFFGCNPPGDGLVRQEGDREFSSSMGVPRMSLSKSAQAPLLDRGTRDVIETHGSAIRAYAEKYGFDWRFVLAVIKCESSFDIAAQSRKGASGLMQLMPTTGEELCETLEVDVLGAPEDNIHGGVYYMGQLYGLFEGARTSDRLRLTLAAYNAGIGRVYDAQVVAAYLHEDPYRWESVKDALPLLSKRYHTLHKNVWDGEKPKSGWFGSSRETVAYVEKAMEYYDEYRLVLN